MSKIEKIKSIEIDGKKSYILPKYKLVKRNEITLAIAVETANWIVLKNEKEVEIFKYLAEKNTIEEVVSKYSESMESILRVIVELEAKQFENINVDNIENGETMQLYITNGCNLRCKHCYMYAGYKKDKELTINEIKKLCNEFKNIGGKYITLTGGEVSTREDFSEILKEINNGGLRMHILSNGVKVSDKIIDDISKYNVERVQISLDGVNEETNSLIRGRGVFKQAIETIDKMVKKGIAVEVAVTPLYEVVIENKQLYIDFAKKLLQKYKDCNFTINFSLELLEGRNLNEDTVKKQKKEYMNLMLDVTKEVFKDSGDIDEENFIDNHKEHKLFNNCGYGRINVSAEGDIFFCSRITQVKKYANIRENSFKEIIELMKSARKVADINNLMPCRKCELKYICGGGCRINEFIGIEKENLVNNITDDMQMSQRECSIENKNKLYDLMISCNERLYR